jgi:hypothetical protein
MNFLRFYTYFYTLSHFLDLFNAFWTGITISRKDKVRFKKIRDSILSVSPGADGGLVSKKLRVFNAINQLRRGMGNPQQFD